MRAIFDDSDQQTSPQAPKPADPPPQPQAEPPAVLPGDDLSDAMRAFAEAWFVSGDRTGAYRVAYPDAKPGTARPAALKLSKDRRVTRYMEWLALQTKSGAEPDIGLNSQQIQARLAAAATFDIARCYYPAGHERAGEIMSVIDMPADVRKLIDGVEEITLKGGAVKRRVLFAPRIQSLSLLAELRGDKARVKGVAKPAGPRATFNINIGPGRRKGKPGDRGRVIEAEQRSISAPDSEQDEETGASA